MALVRIEMLIEYLSRHLFRKLVQRVGGVFWVNRGTCCKEAAKSDLYSKGGCSEFFFTACSSLGQTLIAESSTIKTLTSPNYPSDYDSNTDCLWTIETSQRNGYIVEVTFDDFRLESDNVRSCGNHDYLVVYDGLPQSGSTIGTFCGFMDTPAKVYSTGRYLSLRFSTNMGFSYKGFKLSYFAVQAGKEGEVLCTYAWLCC